MKREKFKECELLVGYHTQEHWPKELTGPIPCNRTDAWLGKGYYFWIDETFAGYWGHDSKRRTGHFDIYKCLLDESGILNATFNEKEYYFFVKSIEKARLHLAKTNQNITLEKVHRFLADKVWTSLNVHGIIFDDIPMNNQFKGRIYSDIKPLYYNKRIQVVVFNKENIITFDSYRIKEKCN